MSKLKLVDWVAWNAPFVRSTFPSSATLARSNGALACASMGSFCGRLLAWMSRLVGDMPAKPEAWALMSNAQFFEPSTTALTENCPGGRSVLIVGPMTGTPSQGFVARAYMTKAGPLAKLGMTERVLKMDS